MEPIKKVARRTKKFVQDHKVAITAVTVGALALKLNKMALKSHDDFLKDHNLYETYYTPEDEQ